MPKLLRSQYHYNATVVITQHIKAALKALASVTLRSRQHERLHGIAEMAKMIIYRQWATGVIGRFDTTYMLCHSRDRF